MLTTSPTRAWWQPATGKSLGRICDTPNSSVAPNLLIHDAQYTAEEYPAKVGWGHSSVEYVVNLGRFAQVKKVALTHHDPLRDETPSIAWSQTSRQSYGKMHLHWTFLLRWKGRS